MKRLRSVDTLLPSLLARLSAGERKALAIAGDLARTHGSDLYLVGGSVRDLLLGRVHLDLDFVVECDARSMARAVGRATGAAITLHDWSRTAVIKADDIRFDLVTARRETYPAPGALPVIEPAGLTDDLARRDFSINAMALAATGARAGTLIDPHNGHADLAAGVLRVLHDRSFRDDATRLWRAGRYAARMTLAIEPQTESLARAAGHYLDTISSARILHEVQRVLDEGKPERALRVLDHLGVLAATDPALRFQDAEAAAFPRLRRPSPADRHAAYTSVLALGLVPREIERLIGRLDPPRHTAAALRALPELCAVLERLVGERATPGVAAPALDRFPEAAICAVAARYARMPAGRVAQEYLDHWRHVRPALDGVALQEMGVPHGPLIGEILRALRSARLDGRIATLDDERRLVHTVLGGAGTSLPAPSA